MAKLRLRHAGFAAAVVALVAGFEGLSTVAYRDSVGIPTICFGETRGVHMGTQKTVAECKTMLAGRLVQFEAGMVGCLVDPERIPDESWAAFVSFTYNVGVGAFCSSTLRRKLNAGDLVGACNELPKWVHAGPFVLPGLVTRRKAEQALCLEGARHG